MKKLWLGALKSGVSAATGLIIALPVVDPFKFSLRSLGGWEHVLEVIGVVVAIGEARYWNQWANNGGSKDTPQV